MKVYLISAKAGHGKDTLAQMMKEEFEKRGQRTVIVHYADYLKYICSQYLGWDGNKDEKGRTLLQHFGSDVIRKQQPNFWVNIVKELIFALKSEFDNVIIPDCRFDNEITYLQNYFDIHTIRVNRINYSSTLTEIQQQHQSETALDKWKFDTYFENNTLIELEKQVVDFIMKQS